jgi:hypothetical protein
MSTREKTYTFRGPADLGSRVRDAFGRWDALLEESDDAADVGQQLSLLFIRHRSDFQQFENQSQFLRATFDLFVRATEKVAEDRARARQYREWAEQDSEASELRAGALRASAARWRDE